MQLIVLTGLVITEKQQLACDLARHYQAQGERAVVLDNGVGIASADDLRVEPLKGDLDQLAEKVAQLAAEVVVLAAHPGTSPQVLFATLDALSVQQPDLQVRTLVLIDTRTCDCFPHLREELEMHADVFLNVPFSLDDALKSA